MRLHPARVWLLLASAWSCSCGDDPHPKQPSAVEAEVSDDISTVVNVRWRTSEPAIGYVEYGLSEELGLKTPLEGKEREEHALQLLGLKPDSLYHYRVVSWDGDDAAASEIETIRTGDLPAGMPRLDLEGDGHDQLTLVPVIDRTKAALVVIDADGEIVWYHTDERDLQFYRMRLARDGKTVLYNAASVTGDPAENSELVRVALDGSSTSSVPVPLLAHDFVELEDGTLAAIAVEYRDFEGKQLRGDKIVEVGEDGELTTVWTSWDCFDPAEWTGDDIEHGWTFANALDYDPAEDAYYLGMRNFSSIAKIDRKSGECEWVLGLSASTFEFAEGSARFLHQHQFELRGNRLLVMDNDGSPGNTSRVIEYELDFEAKLATEVWSYSADPTVYTFVLGEPSRMDDGSVFVNWSAAGQLERVSEAGESLWKLNSGAGFIFGFHTSAPTLYPRDAKVP